MSLTFVVFFRLSTGETWWGHEGSSGIRKTPSPRGPSVIPSKQETIVHPLAGDTNKGADVTVAGTPRRRSTNYVGNTESQRGANPERGASAHKQEPLMIDEARCCPRCLLGPGAGGPRQAGTRLRPIRQFGQGGAARELLQEAMAKTRSRPGSDDTTKAMLENIARRHDLGQASKQKTPTKPRRTDAAGAFTKTSRTPTRKPHAARPKAPRITTSKSRARPPKNSTKLLCETHSLRPRLLSSTSSSTKPEVKKKSKGITKK